MARKQKAAVVDHHRSAENGQSSRVHTAASLSTNASGSGQQALVTQRANADSLAPIIAEIRAWHRQRVFAMDQRKRADLALGAFLRTQLGWSRANDAPTNAKIRKRVADLIALGEKVAKGKETGIGNSAFGQWSAVILAAIHGRSHWDAIEATATKEMERLASSLPVWPVFGEPIKGFGPRSLAVIVGEAGDLANYANPGKLWKRMGLAVVDGVRQGGLRKTASKEDWIAHGYNAKRRSMVFVIGDVLIKNKNEYRDVYLQRKEYERAKAAERGLIVVPAAKIPVKRANEFMSDGHVHRRAQRYMEKRLLRDLWKAWRRATKSVLISSLALPAASSSAQAEPQTKSSVQTTGRLSEAPSSAGTAERSASVDLSSKQTMPSALIPVKAGKRRAIFVVKPM